jgi:hypothetical protein
VYLQSRQSGWRFQHKFRKALKPGAPHFGDGHGYQWVRRFNENSSAANSPAAAAQPRLGRLGKGAPRGLRLKFGTNSKPSRLMLIHKFFHVTRSLPDTQKRFESWQSQQQALQSGCPQPAPWEWPADTGPQEEITLECLPSAHSRQIIFRSLKGPIELAGLIEFFPIRDNFTEVELTADCTFSSTAPGAKAWDAWFEDFLNAQLQRMEQLLNEPACSLPLDAG